MRATEACGPAAARAGPWDGMDGPGDGRAAANVDEIVDPGPGPMRDRWSFLTFLVAFSIHRISAY